MVRGGMRAWLAAVGATAAVACAAHAPPAEPDGNPAGGPSADRPAAPRTSGPPTANAPTTASAAPNSPLPTPPAPGPAGPPCATAPTCLDAPGESAERIGLSTLLFDREDRPTLLEERLLISGIDPRDVRDFLQAYNRRSELLQFTPEGVAFAPHVLERALSLPPTQLLQFRFSGQTGKLVFRLVFP